MIVRCASQSAAAQHSRANQPAFPPLTLTLSLLSPLSQVKIWAGDSKKPVAIIDEKNGIDDTVTGLAYCPATMTLWMASNSAHPLVYDPRSATDITPFLRQTDTSASDQKNQKDRVQKLFRIEQTGELIATTSTRNLQVWRYNPNGAAAILRAHTDWAEVLAHCYKKFAIGDGQEEGESDQMILFSGGADSLIRRWEPASRMNPYIYSQTEALVGHTGAVLCALYCEAADMFVTGGDDATIRLWPIHDVEPDAESGAEEEEEAEEDDDVIARPSAAPQQAQPMVLREHTDRVTGLVAYGSTIGSVSWDLSIRLWDVDQCIREMKGGEEPKSTHVLIDAHDDYILSMAHSPELAQIASASADQGVKLWNLDSEVEPSEDASSGSLVPEGRKGKLLCGTLNGHEADVSHVKWNPVHGLWVTGSEDHTVKMWTPEGVCKWEIRPPGDAVTALAIDLNGFILVASMDAAVRVYDAETQEVVQQHNGHSDAVRCIIHVPEKSQYLTASWDRTIRVWRAYKPPKGYKPPSERVEEAEGEEGMEGLGDTMTAAEAPVTAPAAAADEDEVESEEEFPWLLVKEKEPYSVRFPLVEPKCLADRGKSAGDKFISKPKKDEGRKRPGKEGDDGQPAKQPTGLAAELNKLEASLIGSLKLEQPEVKQQASTSRRRPGRR